MSTPHIPTILIVDDQPDVIDAITGYLSNSDTPYRFLQAINGQMACEVAEKRMPNLIIMDWEMPIMNGFEALLAIKGNQSISHIPIIMATGRSSPDDLDKALNAGAADYIRKPIERQELLARVRTCLDISKYIREIQITNDKLLDLNREKDGIVNVVAHDLRLPLCTIVGFTELIKHEGHLSEHQTEYLSNIDKVIQNGMSLIDDLLDVHSYEYGDSKVATEKIDLFDFIQNWQKTFDLDLRKKDQKLQLNINLSNSYIHTNNLLLARILNNLMSNAIKFSKKQKTIYLSVNDLGETVELSIKDEGPGINDDDKKRMFKLFQKLSARPTNGESSNGIGLSIVKKLVQKLNGEIEVVSEVGIGTEFIVKLPKTSASNHSGV